MKWGSRHRGGQPDISITGYLVDFLQVPLGRLPNRGGIPPVNSLTKSEVFTALGMQAQVVSVILGTAPGAVTAGCRGSEVLHDHGGQLTGLPCCAKLWRARLLCCLQFTRCNSNAPLQDS